MQFIFDDQLRLIEGGTDLLDSIKDLLGPLVNRPK